jgi:hypothetical protein
MTDLEKIATDCRAAAALYKKMSSPTGNTFADIYQQLERIARAADKAQRPMAFR